MVQHLRHGHAVFVKLWSDPPLPADIVARRITLLDRAFRQIAADTEDIFPSPYGGAVVLADLAAAIRAATALMNLLATNQIEASIAITVGTFQRVHNVSGWSAAALALNRAARVASWPETKGRICVDEDVRRQAIQVADDFRLAIDSHVHWGEVKGYRFKYYWVRTETIKAKPIEVSECAVPPATAALVLVVDIAKYSSRTPSQQEDAVRDFNRCVLSVIDETGVQPTEFCPAGDGGYFPFSADSPPRVFDFVHKLLKQAKSLNVPIRAGLVSGPVIKTEYRSAVGEAILEADRLCSEAPIFGVTVPEGLWNELGDLSKSAWPRVKRTEETVRLEVGHSPWMGPSRWWVIIVILIAVLTLVLLFDWRGPTSLDIERAGFVSSGWMGDITNLRLESSHAEPYSSPISQMWSWTPSPGAEHTFVAVAWQFPPKNFGDQPGKDWNKMGFKRISVWARGVRAANGKLPTVQFKAGNTTEPGKRHQATFGVAGDFVTLTEDWKEYTLPLRGEDLSQVIAAFVFVIRASDAGPEGVTFHLDDIRYK